ncbi:MAG: ABC-type transport auxiliary lipoprotein family protein [Sphingomonas sp.]|jgi:cholesterol transport system auxiliary component
MMRPIPRRLIASLVPGLALAGCISLAAKPPASLMTLTATAIPAAGQTVSSANAPTIAISVPVTPAAIATQRVPVQTSATAFAYVKDALWSEPPARLFTRLLSDTVATKTGRVVLSDTQALGSHGAMLSGQLSSFGVDEAAGNVVVIYEATLRRGPDHVYEKRRFEARSRLPRIDADTVGPALNRAANQVASDVAEWVGK